MDGLDLEFPDMEIRRLIGTGGMGEVYLAARGDDLFAVKVLDPTLEFEPMFVDRFQREAAALSRLDHPNIVRLIDRGYRNGHTYLILEHLNGITLRARMKQGPPSDAGLLAIMTQLCGALEHCHERDVIHRDVRPENILLVGDRLVLVDFGVAKIPDGGDPVIVENPDYSAPEEKTGEAAVDGRTDVFSLGVLLFEMLSGSPPTGKVGTDPRFAEVVKSAVEPDPGKRTGCVARLREDLEQILKSDDKADA